MKDITLENSGNRLVINCASMDEVSRLKQAILNELKKSPLGFKIFGNNENIFEKEVDISGVIEFIKNSLIGLETSKEFEEAVFECLKYCTYKTTEKINKALFEKYPEAREDYYEIIIACVEENLRPFIKSLVSVLKTRLSNLGIAQKLEQIMSAQKSL